MARATRLLVHALHSSLLDRHGFRHLFSTRAGGVSRAPYDSLNLGFHLGDDEDAVRENRARFAEWLGVPLDRLYEQRQVHGVHVRELNVGDTTTAVADAEGDALIARRPGVAVAARTADCVPLLLADRDTGAVAAVHAGWRGAVSGVVRHAVRALCDDPASVLAAIGPHIRMAAFEIGDEVAMQLESAARGRPVVDRSGAKPHGDLASLVRLQLRDVGLDEASIDDVGGCTYTDATTFFSHRRDRGRTGRHLSAIVASC